MSERITYGLADPDDENEPRVSPRLGCSPLAKALLRCLNRFSVEFLDGDSRALLPAAQVVRAGHQCGQLFGVAEVIGNVCPDEVCADGWIQEPVGDLTGDPVGHRPLCGPGVCGRESSPSSSSTWSKSSGPQGPDHQLTISVDGKTRGVYTGTLSADGSPLTFTDVDLALGTAETALGTAKTVTWGCVSATEEAPTGPTHVTFNVGNQTYPPPR
ncbi:hypothetical protein M4D73_09115 [Streptomyces pseudogriseolus]|uniref:hypothetical protein n=1 Tax=Streptomyces pseudogriseolus TaxID=36817 RepID=UPI003FA1B54A|nr:hypothetical protein [Streptomyces pseudogriseolus]